MLLIMLFKTGKLIMLRIRSILIYDKNLCIISKNPFILFLSSLQQTHHAKNPFILQFVQARKLFMLRIYSFFIFVQARKSH
jgi:hypothetical protein